MRNSKLIVSVKALKGFKQPNSLDLIFQDCTSHGELYKSVLRIGIVETLRERVSAVLNTQWPNRAGGRKEFRETS